jgi:hypothetical protein
MRWSEPPPAVRFRFTWLQPFHCDPRALSAAVAHLVLVRSNPYDMLSRILISGFLAGFGMAACFEIMVSAVGHNPPFWWRTIALACGWIVFWLPGIWEWFFGPYPNDSMTAPYWWASFVLLWLLYSSLIYGLVAYFFPRGHSPKDASDPPET